MERMFETEVLPLCQQLDIGFVAFSPLASGFLAGKIQGAQTYEGDDVRRVITRFNAANVAANQPLVNTLRRFADHKGATSAQISLAWMLAKWPFVTPIPGSRKIERIDENLAAADVELTPDELARIEKALATMPIHGNRTDEDIARLRREPVQNS
jgi:aryl-alcohol dehydrogenase-like predicted oxidoreductase